jgi:choline dehydrogenase-like flavoprotein
VKRRRKSTLRALVTTFAPADARIERVVALCETAIDGLSPRRNAEMTLLLDLLALPLRLPLAGAPLLRRMADAPLAKLRSGFAAFKRLVLFLAYAESETGAPNPTWARIGYPGPRDDRDAREQPFALARARDGETLEADVVVIGSGAGGGVAAAEFARAGKRAIVLEAGGAYFAQDYTQREQSFGDLYLDRGLTSSKDAGVVLLAGATLGGGTSINWSTALRLPARIASEWETESGIASLGAELEPHFAALETELGLAPLERHNANNAVIADGCRALGIHHDAQPRNAPGDCGEGCGYCGFGCAYAKKRSTVRVHLPDVVAAGGAIYAGASATRILFDGRRARGIEGVQTDPDGTRAVFSVRAERVVCAAGALRTPGLLARSGVSHPLLGRRLFVHPVVACFAEFDRPIEAYRGPMQTAYSDAYNYRSGNYGAKIEVAPAHPGLAALALPWRSRRGHAERMSAMRNAATLIALTRDRDPGSIDLDDEAAIRYAVSPFDAENLYAGLLGLFDVSFAAGAMRVASLHNTPIEIAREDWNAARRAALARTIGAIGIESNRQPVFSAHQMGTAPLGADRRTSVVAPDGTPWGYENLLVADASLFPQSSGVNPMLTIMALARRIAHLHR